LFFQIYISAANTVLPNPKNIDPDIIPHIIHITVRKPLVLIETNPIINPTIITQIPIIFIKVDIP
jgi:hypothetical protein